MKDILKKFVKYYEENTVPSGAKVCENFINDFLVKEFGGTVLALDSCQVNKDNIAYCPECFETMSLSPLPMELRKFCDMLAAFNEIHLAKGCLKAPTLSKG